MKIDSDKLKEWIEDNKEVVESNGIWFDSIDLVCLLNKVKELENEK